METRASAASDLAIPQPHPQSRGQQPILSPTEPVQERLEKLWADPPGFFGWFRALQNDALGGRIMMVGFSFFIISYVIKSTSHTPP